MLRLSLLLFVCFAFLHATLAGAADPVQTDLFVSGQAGYHTYRIPSLIVSPKGAVLAFCEARKSGRGDAGNIDMILRRSTDGGMTWGNIQVVWDDDANTCGNPCPVVDAKSGTNISFDDAQSWRGYRGRHCERQKQGHPDRSWITSSTDDRRNVVESRSRSPRMWTKKGWTWYATGPGVGHSTKERPAVDPMRQQIGQREKRASHMSSSATMEANRGSSAASLVPSAMNLRLSNWPDGSVMLKYEIVRRQSPATRRNQQGRRRDIYKTSRRQRTD